MVLDCKRCGFLLCCFGNITHKGVRLSFKYQALFWNRNLTHPLLKLKEIYKMDYAIKTFNWTCKIQFYSILILCCSSSHDVHVYKLQYNPERAVHLKMKTLPPFTHPYLIPNQYDDLSSGKHRRCAAVRYRKNVRDSQFWQFFWFGVNYSFSPLWPKSSSCFRFLGCLMSSL